MDLKTAITMCLEIGTRRIRIPDIVDIEDIFKYRFNIYEILLDSWLIMKPVEELKDLNKAYFEGYQKAIEDLREKLENEVTVPKEFEELFQKVFRDILA